MFKSLKWQMSTINAEVKLPALECHFRHIQAVRLEKVI